MIFSNISYVGEHLIYGELGNLALVLGFVFALLSAGSYFLSTQNNHQLKKSRAWKNLGRLGFIIQSISVFAVIGLLFYLLIQKHYEYAYVYDHTSDDLPFKYIFSAFWEGQEGSFLLWAFWHVILGLILLWKRGEWEAPVLAVVALVQAFILSMLLGVYIGEGTDAFKIGINPFLLLRDTVDAPIFNNADYLSLIEGRGLNALLQNYWMTIHPPTLFLGFASTTIPFAFAMAGLWTGNFKSWLQPAFPWVAFSAGVLGVGILMGGAWAYEALTFGGYWAWDPVENMSLVPWLMLVAGIHAHLIAQSTGHSLKATFAFYILTFFLIVYSTFLVRSGILEETSVHAFVESGLEKQLLVFLLFFPLLGFITYFRKYKLIPSPKTQEKLQSREFWMFTGTMVLGISAILITFFTSLPVINALMTYFDPLHEPMVINDPVEHYNRSQLWIALFIGLLSGVGQWTRYNERNVKLYKKTLLLHLGLAAVFAFILSYISLYWLNAVAWQYQLLLFSGFYAIISNTDHFLRVVKHYPKSVASWFSHAGFGIMIIGILASGLNKQVISTNLFAQQGLLGLDEETLQSNIILLKGSPMVMNGYEATYVDDSMDGFYRTYDIRFVALDSTSENQDTFTLRPNIIYNSDYTKVEAYNPDTRRRWNYDVFTHLSGLPPQEMNFQEARNIEDSLDYTEQMISPGDTLEYNGTFIYSEFTNEIPIHDDYEYKEGDMVLGLDITTWSNEFTQAEEKSAFLLIRDNALYQFGAYFPDTRLKIKLPESFADVILENSESQSSTTIELEVNDSTQWGNFNIHLSDIIQSPESPNYQAQEGDVAIGAQLDIQNAAERVRLKPIFYIRNDEINFVEDRDTTAKIGAQLIKIDPEKSSFTFVLSREKIKWPDEAPITIAENVPRSDYLVLSTIKFPGINLFWLGSIMMLFGFFVSMIFRWNTKA
jgi:cytochrome c-type biogenesis protein CcmF